MAISLLFASFAGVVAVGVPVKEGEEIVLFVKVSAPVKVASVPVVGNVILVTPVLTNVVLKLPAVTKSAVVEILPPKLIVLVPLLTPVPPNSPVIAEAKGAVPSKSLPYILLGVCNFVVVLALPTKLPVTLPVTSPVTFPVNDAVIIPALKFPLKSLSTRVLGVLFEVAEATLELIVVIVEELTPPTLFTVGNSAVPPKSLVNFNIPFALELASTTLFDKLVWTKAVVAICVVLVVRSAVGALGIPVNSGDAILALLSNADCVKVLMGLSASDVLSTLVILELILVESLKILARKTDALSNKDLFKVVESVLIFAAEYTPNATQSELFNVRDNEDEFNL